MNEHPRSEPAPTIAGHPRNARCTEPPTPEPELSLARIERRAEPPGPALALEGELDIRGKSKLRAIALSRFAIVAVVLIVLIIMAGKVLIAWRDGAAREAPRHPSLSRCTQHVERIERTEWTCDGP